MVGVELCHADGRAAGDVAGAILGRMLSRGLIMLADGPEGNVLAFTPPFGLSETEIEWVVSEVALALNALG